MLNELVSTVMMELVQMAGSQEQDVEVQFRALVALGTLVFFLEPEPFLRTFLLHIIAKTLMKPNI